MPDLHPDRSALDDHAVARALCFEVYGDWRYDPGDIAYDPFLHRANELLDAFEAAGLRVVGAHNA